MIATLTALTLAAAVFTPPQVTVDPAGTWRPGQADITGTERCDNSGKPGGDRATLQVYVRDLAGFTQAYGYRTVPCDSLPHPWLLTTQGPGVQPGPVTVQAVLITQTGTASVVQPVLLA